MEKEVNSKENAKSKEGDIPTFTPPEQAPVFEPPKGDGMATNKCYHHPSELAVAQCVHCGKFICKDCAETFAVSTGKYANQHLCYDCCQALFKEQQDDLTANKNVIKKQFILTLIGVVIGFIFGLTGGSFIVGLIFAMIGGVFLTAIKPIASAFWDFMKGIFHLATGDFGSALGNIFSGLIQFLGVAVSSTIATFSKIVTYSVYLGKANKAIQETKAALAQLEEFMQYMEVRLKSKNFDLDSMLAEGSELYNNSYARTLRDKGENAADAILARATTTIAENGEIIRSFAA